MSSQEQLPSSVGFVGLGSMGWWMALNVRKALPPSATLYIYDVINSALDKFVAKVTALEGDHSVEYGPVVPCKSSKEVAANSDVTFVIVPEGHHVRSAFLDLDGLLSAPVDNKVFIDCSTIDTATSLLVAKAVAEASPTAKFYDAPVSGGTIGAKRATLTFMVGAKEDDEYFRSQLQPLLRTMGENIFCLGGPTLGLVAKLSNNYLSGIIAIATSEAMNLGMRHGIDPKVLRDCFSRSTAGNWVNDSMNPVPGVCPDAVTSKGYKGGFKIQLMRKDFALAVDSAREVGAKLVLGETGLATYTAAAEDPRCRDLDSRSVYRWLGGEERPGSFK